jgi:hypothetical protein
LSEEGGFVTGQTLFVAGDLVCLLKQDVARASLAKVGGWRRDGGQA